MVFLFLCSVSLLIYRGLADTFYQQDEWIGLGHVLTEGIQSFLKEYTWWEIAAGQGRILATPLNYLAFHYMPYSMWPFAMMAWIMHGLTAILVYKIAQILTKNNTSAFFAGLYFVIGMAGRQAVTWAGAITTTLPSALFFVLSLLLLLRGLKDHKRIYTITSVISLVVSYYFKESTIVFFFLYPALLIILSGEKRTALYWIRKYWAWSIFPIITTFLRMVGFVRHGAGTGMFVQATGGGMWAVVLHALWYPVVSLSQMFVAPSWIFSFAPRLLAWLYPQIALSTIAPIVAEQTIADLISFILSILVLPILYLVWRKNKNFRYAIVASLAVITASIVPYSILTRGTAFLESRYYYHGMIGAAILFGVVVSSFYAFSKMRFVPIVLAVGFLLFQIQVVSEDIIFQKQLALDRKNFLSSITKAVATIPDKPVFYLTGNSDYGGIPIPLQQGPGYTLMVLFFLSGKISDRLITENYLWGMRDQGYRTVGTKGFGYFWQKEALFDEFRTNSSLDPRQVIAFYYDGKQKKVSDITRETQQELIANNKR